MAQFALLAAQAAGTGLSAYSSYKQGKEEKKYLYEQAAEAEQQARFEQKQNLDRQYLLNIESAEAQSKAKGQAAKAGVRVGKGSASRLRQSIADRYELQKTMVSEASMERQRQLELQGYYARKRGKEAEKAGKWSALTSLLAGGFNIGMGASKLGLFGKTPKPNVTGSVDSWIKKSYDWLGEA